MSKYIDKASATLILRTTAANIIDTSKTSITWQNINMVNLLGDMYNKYDYFNICLVEVGAGVSDANLGLSLDNCAVSFVMSGLPFLSRYDLRTTGFKTNAIVGFLNFPRGSATTQIYYGNNVNTFNKTSTLVDLNIQYNSLIGDTIAATAFAFPDVCFIFKIVGIPKENLGEIDTSRRLKI